MLKIFKKEIVKEIVAETSPSKNLAPLTFAQARDKFAAHIAANKLSPALHLLHDVILKFDAPDVLLNGAIIKNCTILNDKNRLKRYLLNKPEITNFRVYEALAFLCGSDVYEARNYCLQAFRLAKSQNKVGYLSQRTAALIKASNITNVNKKKTLEHNLEIEQFDSVVVIAEARTDLRLLTQLDRSLRVKILSFDSGIKRANATALLRKHFSQVELFSFATLYPEPYSQGDSELCELAEELSHRVVEVVKNDVEAIFDKTEDIKEILALRLEDRFFSQLRLRKAILDFIGNSNNIIFGFNQFQLLHKLPEALLKQNNSLNIYAFQTSFIYKQNIDYIDHNTIIEKEKPVDKARVRSQYFDNLKNWQERLKENKLPNLQGKALFNVSISMDNYITVSQELVKESIRELGEDNTYMIGILREANIRKESPAWEGIIKKENIYFEPFDSVSCLPSNQNQWNMGLFLANKDELEAIFYENNELSLAAGNLIFEVERFFGNMILSFAEWNYKLNDMFTNGKPRYIITCPGRDPKNMMLINIAKQYEITTYDVQAFFHSPHVRYKTTKADYMCVIDEYAYNLYKNHFQMDAAKIFKAGSILIDANLKKSKELNKHVLREKYNIQENDRMLILGTQTCSNDMFTRSLELMIENFKDCENIKIFVKTHPNESASAVGQYKNVIQRHNAGAFCRLLDKCDIYELFPISHALVTLFSNVGLEAAMAGLPILTCNINNEDVPVDFGKTGLALGCNSEEDFIANLELFKTEKGYKKLMQAHHDYKARNPDMFSMDAAKKIIQLAEKNVL
jgi:hypothetical protein